MEVPKCWTLQGSSSIWLVVAFVSLSVLAVSVGAEVMYTPVPKGAPGWLDPASTHYVELKDVRRTGQEQFFCLARGKCHYKTITCPAECPKRKPRSQNNVKGCFADCSSRCETTCKNRKPNCEGYGSICYDPRFVGGDGVMFYFHGAKGADFALVSDDRLQINAHFIGTRPEGRTRDFTWVQALAVLFESHTLVLAARRVAVWDDSSDALAIRWDGVEVSLPITDDGEAEWRKETDGGRGVVVERTGELNSVKITVGGLVEVSIKVVPIGKEENRTHGYLLPGGDAFAHLETQFRFGSLTERVEGILGQTYRPDYVSPVKKGVAMPVMGGEDRYRISSFLSTRCVACHFLDDGPRILEESAGVDLGL